jgi:hypothetical protein
MAQATAPILDSTNSEVTACPLLRQLPGVKQTRYAKRRETGKE